VIQFEDLRPGDKLTFEIEKIIRKAYDGDYVIQFKGSFPVGNHIRPASILHHERPPIKVGDVFENPRGTHLTILQIEGDTCVYSFMQSGRLYGTTCSTAAMRSFKRVTD
jgi:hypothetical protein